MKNSVKFTFDTDFDDRAAEVAEARARKTLSSEEIESLKRDAREEGRKQADILATQAGRLDYFGRTAVQERAAEKTVIAARPKKNVCTAAARQNVVAVAVDASCFEESDDSPFVAEQNVEKLKALDMAPKDHKNDSKRRCKQKSKWPP